MFGAEMLEQCGLGCPVPPLAVSTVGAKGDRAREGGGRPRKRVRLAGSRQKSCWRSGGGCRSGHGCRGGRGRRGWGVCVSGGSVWSREWG
jgi:hypothetical protein